MQYEIRLRPKIAGIVHPPASLDPLHPTSHPAGILDAPLLLAVVSRYPI